MPFYANGLEAHLGDRVKLVDGAGTGHEPEVVIVEWIQMDGHNLPDPHWFFGRCDSGDTWRWSTNHCTRVAKGRSHPTLTTPDRLDG